jgi:DUF2934 family protein
MSADRKPVAELAYELWVARGRPHGSATEDWVEAERQLAATGAASPAKERPEKLLVSPQGQAPSANIPKQKKAKKASASPERKRRVTTSTAPPDKSAKRAKPRDGKGSAGSTPAAAPGDIGEG